ncbi:hypothetical protein F5B18DRAFT_612123 [Nemania serpens]|nr:hypothetical protein F5B18DRAFT_612123 [Nemania serpens]
MLILMVLLCMSIEQQAERGRAGVCVRWAFFQIDIRVLRRRLRNESSANSYHIGGHCQSIKSQEGSFYTLRRGGINYCCI